jgi:hypothetical protein
MSNRVHCTCQRCRIRGLMGPTIVVTVGVLFLLQQLRGGFFDFSNTYPVILIVIGMISLASALASTEGHIDANSPLPPGVPPTASVSPSAVPPSPYQGQGQ